MLGRTTVYWCCGRKEESRVDLVYDNEADHDQNRVFGIADDLQSQLLFEVF